MNDNIQSVLVSFYYKGQERCSSSSRTVKKLVGHRRGSEEKVSSPGSVNWLVGGISPGC